MFPSFVLCFGPMLPNVTCFSPRCASMIPHSFLIRKSAQGTTVMPRCMPRTTAQSAYSNPSQSQPSPKRCPPSSPPTIPQTTISFLPSFLASLTAIRSVSTHIQNCIDTMQSALTQKHHAKATCLQSTRRSSIQSATSPTTSFSTAFLVGSDPCAVGTLPALALSSASLMVIPRRAVVTKEDRRQSGITYSSALCSLTFPSVCCHRRRSLDADGFPCALPSGPARVVWKSGMFTRAPNLTWMDTSCGTGSHPTFHGLRYLHRFSFSALEHLVLDFFTTPGNSLRSVVSAYPPMYYPVPMSPCSSTFPLTPHILRTASPSPSLPALYEASIALYGSLHIRTIEPCGY